MAEIDDLRLRIARLEKQLGLVAAKAVGAGGHSNLVGVKEYVKRFTTMDHGELEGLLDDDHTQYALLNGRSGGQVLIGGTGAGDDLTLQTTSNAVKGSYILTELSV